MLFLLRRAARGVKFLVRQAAPALQAGLEQRGKHAAARFLRHGCLHAGALRGGTVIQSRIVTDKTNLTWEWGNYVTVRTASGEQDIYAHLASRAVKVGDVVKAGDALGVMGNTGNAAGGYKHTHYERRKADGKTAIDPSAVSGCANKAGTYGEAPSTEDKQYTATPLVDGLRLRPYPEADDANCNEALTVLEKGKAYPLVQTRSGWAFLRTGEGSGGWACISDDTTEYMRIQEV